jgi:hypothetical protein
MIKVLQVFLAWLALSILASDVSSQSIPPVLSQNCQIPSVSGYANCHGFVWRYLEKNYDVGYVDCYRPSPEDIKKLNDAASGRIRGGMQLLDQLLEKGSRSDHDVVAYMQDGLPTHTAVKSGFRYISKWESRGPVVRHYLTTVPEYYYNPNDSRFEITYWKKPKSCEPPSLSISVCTECSCTTNQGAFVFRAPTSGWSNYTWSVTGGSISRNMGSYIYVEKPNGGFVGVTLTATYTKCGEIRSKYQSFDLPNCSNCQPPSLSISACTNCSCTNYQGDFIFRAPISGWSNYSWSVSGGSISWDMGSYIYVNKPHGGFVGVTLTATYTECSEVRSKYQSFYLPNCSNDAWRYTLRGGAGLEIQNQDQVVKLVFPQEVVKYIQNQNSQMMIYSVDGRLLKQQTLNANQNYVEFKKKPSAGIYILKIVHEDNSTYSRKLWLE